MNIPGNDDPIVNQDNDITNSEDIHDSPKDQEQLKSQTAIMDLPEVKDIPGQENIEPMPLGELADTTISSDDEEGVGILDFENEDDDALTNSSEEVTNQGNKEDTDTAIEDGAQLKGADKEQITNAKDQATNDMGADEEA
ncbi:MAG: hypothetical protein ABIR81_10280 [Ginsengibacter sp.]